jgi:xanthine dehydrogenase accessory factor
MANRLNQMLGIWQPQKDSMDWVLATIVATDGSSYRKIGAMMMINSLGQYYGLLSGGCLESDIMRQARRCWQSKLNKIIQYDMREEEDLAWQLGIGCGGLVRILLQPVDADNDYLHLDQVYEAIKHYAGCVYQQHVDENKPDNQLIDITSHKASNSVAGTVVEDTPQGLIVRHNLLPPPHLAVFGGGADARPLVAMAAELGWQVSLVDPRTAYAREAYFPAVNIVRTPLEQLYDASWLQQIDMAVLMNHNVKLDGQALALVQSSSAVYVGMLGPVHRTERVLQSANLTRRDLRKPLANPIGLRLGGELPESIALAILSEAHAYIEQADAQSISGIL